MKRTLLVLFPLCFFMCASKCTQQTQTTIGNSAIVGEWFIPHSAFIKLMLNENGSFDFYNYDTIAEQEVCLNGQYKIEQNIIVLSFQEKSSIVFTILCDEINNYYLINEDYYFVKSD